MDAIVLQNASHVATVIEMLISIVALYKSSQLTKENNAITEEGDRLAISMNFPFLQVEEASIDNELFDDIIDGSVLDINNTLYECGFGKSVKVLALKIKNTGNIGISAIKCRRIAVFSGNDNYVYNEIAKGEIFEETEKENRFFNIQLLNNDPEVKTVNILAEKSDICLADYIENFVEKKEEDEYITLELELDTIAINHLQHKNYLVCGLETGEQGELKVKYSEFRTKGSGFNSSNS